MKHMLKLDEIFTGLLTPLTLDHDETSVTQVQSILCEPSTNTVLSGANGVSSITLRGIAWSGAGRGICRVECSLDGGKNFTAAELLPQEHLEEVREPSTVVQESSTNWY